MDGVGETGGVLPDCGVPPVTASAPGCAALLPAGPIVSFCEVRQGPVHSGKPRNSHELLKICPRFRSLTKSASTAFYSVASNLSKNVRMLRGERLPNYPPTYVTLNGCGTDGNDCPCQNRRVRTWNASRRDWLAHPSTQTDTHTLTIIQPVTSYL